MKYYDMLIEKASVLNLDAAFPESDDPDMLRAIAAAAEKGICHPVLVGAPEAIRKNAEETGTDISKMEIVNAGDEEFLKNLIGKYLEYSSLLSEKALFRKAKDPLYVALMMEAVGMVKTTIAGFIHSTAAVSMAGQAIIGLKEGYTSVTCVCPIEVPDREGDGSRIVFCGDCAYTVDPTSEQMATLAIDSCEAMKKLLDIEPKCAMLSYSTCESAKGPGPEKVCEAVKIANERRPDLAIDGEFQLDAAVSPIIGAKKCKRESKVAGQANVLIFPSLEAGNISMKIFQQFAGAEVMSINAFGFKKPVQDCSRGNTGRELLSTIAINCLMAKD